MLRANISDLRRGLRHVEVEGRVQTMGPVKELQLPEPLMPARYAVAILKDDTGEVKVSLWNYDLDGVSEGSRVRIEDGYVTTFKGELRLNVSFYGRVVTI